ncbi:MAG: RNase adaptor protein RapZ, partial [Firmicutes bacterium]|nr:RNase adaptor protein RapZ [Bacillota bacterium]
EADITTIVNRYKETRRRHPLAQEGMSIETAVERESALLEQVRERADYVINTTGKNIAALQNELYTLFVSDSVKRPLSVNVISFGFKHGIPIESDMVFDVRFLPNPFYVSELRSLTGLDKPVSDYVFSFGDAAEFLRKLKEMMRFLLPLFVEEGKHSLTVAVGCTGGKHRSVAIAAALTDAIADLGYGAQLINRDISKG